MLLVLAGPVSADEDDAPAGQAESSVLKTIEQAHALSSDMLEGVLHRTDALFGGEQSYAALTGSYVQLGLAATLRRPDDGDNQFSPITGARINLPRTSRRLQLLYDRDIENIGRTESQRDARVAAGQTAPDDNPYLGLRAIAAKTLRLELNADAGLRVRGGDLDPFTRLRARRLFSAGSWAVPVAEALMWRRTEGFSAATDISFLRTLNLRTVLALSSNVTWRSFTQQLDLSQIGTLIWSINDRSLLVTEFGIYGQTEPNLHATAYSAALRYRRRIHSDWLIFEARPQLIYPSSNGFRPVPTLTLQVEVYFGQAYLPGP